MKLWIGEQVERVYKFIYLESIFTRYVCGRYWKESEKGYKVNRVLYTLAIVCSITMHGEKLDDLKKGTTSN